MANVKCIKWDGDVIGRDELEERLASLNASVLDAADAGQEVSVSTREVSEIGPGDGEFRLVGRVFGIGVGVGAGSPSAG